MSSIYSRRAFVKKTVVATAAGTLAEKSKSLAAKSTSRDPSNPGRPNQASKRLGAAVEKSPNSRFTLRRRLPGWQADTIGGARPTDEDEYLFLEEAVGKDENKFKYFPPPRHQADFREPDPRTGTPQSWGNFNKWILGHELKENPLATPSQKAFYALLFEITQRVRRYNAALYWMRRLHFHENTPAGSPSMPYNRHGDRLEDLSQLPEQEEALKTIFLQAEEKWKDAVDDLNKILAGKTDFGKDTDGKHLKYISADFVEVNNYIVSMRIVADSVNFIDRRPAKRADRPVRVMEIGGSSSSHISISSAFCSSGC